MSGLQDSLLGGDVLGEHRRTLGGQAVGTSTILRSKSSDQSSTLKPSEYLVERAGGEVYARKLLYVFHEGVAVLVASREAREYEDGGTSVSPQSG